MSTQVTFMLPDDVYASALRLARLTRREVADVLRDVLALTIPALASDMPALASDAEASPSLGSLEDVEILALTKLTLPPEQDARLSALLERRQAGSLDDAERCELTSLMQAYQEGLLRKAQAMEEAARRGLQGPLPP